MYSDKETAVSENTDGAGISESHSEDISEKNNEMESETITEIETYQSS